MYEVMYEVFHFYPGNNVLNPTLSCSFYSAPVGGLVSGDEDTVRTDVQDSLGAGGPRHHRAGPVDKDGLQLSDQTHSAGG